LSNSADILNLLRKKQGGNCYFCGKPLSGSPTEVHHVIPVSRGGSNELENLALVHRSCHLRETLKAAPYGLLVRSSSFVLLLLVMTYVIMFLVVAWITTLAISPSTISGVASLLITVEGILLGLTGLSSMSKRTVKSLVALATMSVMWSLVTVLLADVQSGIYASRITTSFFFVDVVTFSLVVGAYAIAVIGPPVGRGA
jgi:hypothetical protein